MRIILTLPLAMVLLVTSGCTTPKAPRPEAEAYFAYPHAVVTVESKTLRTKFTGEVIRSFSPPTRKNPIPHTGFSYKLEDGTEVTWEFVKATWRGDVYVIAAQQPGHPDVIKPVLLAGEPVTVIQDTDLTVRILPERPPTSH